MPHTGNMLVYRLGSLGDTVVALPCFHLIRRAYPRHKITILTNLPVSEKAAPAMAILENSGLCDAAIYYPVGTRSVFKLDEVRKNIRKIRPDVVVNLAAGRGVFKSLRDELFFRSCGVRRIIGTPFQKRELRAMRTATGEYEAESQRLAARLALLGDMQLADWRLWDLGLTADERSLSAGFLPPGNGNVLAVSVGTKVPVKDWGESNWAMLLALLSRHMPGAKLVLLGAMDEWERSERVSRAWAGEIANLCGMTSPRVSAAILERCRLFIGHDSGPMHLASAAGTPTLGIFSWFNPPGQWFPGHKSWKTVRVLYPPLPEGGWKPGLQARKGVAEGILLHQPEQVLDAALELWHSSPSLMARLTERGVPLQNAFSSGSGDLDGKVIPMNPGADSSKGEPGRQGNSSKSGLT